MILRAVDEMEAIIEDNGSGSANGCQLERAMSRMGRVREIPARSGPQATYRHFARPSIRAAWPMTVINGPSIKQHHGVCN